METKISDVVDSLREIQKLHGDLPVLAITDDEKAVWEPARVRESKRGMAMVVRIEGLS